MSSFHGVIIHRKSDSFQQMTDGRPYDSHIKAA